jgi:cellulose synthase/poly-beta-1,6-N-acetylglucosamine synthase-like glycosyltransferase
LRRLAEWLGDPCIGWASGRRLANNPLTTPVATLCAFEQLVHQMITMRAKDRLGLAPASLGSNCLYRAAALAQVGGFRPGALLEDSELTLRLAAAGWMGRFAVGARSYHAVPESVVAYWRQHLRWQRGFDQARSALGKRPRLARLSPPLWLELRLFSLGYADRLAFAAALALAPLGRGGRALRLALGTAAFTPFLQLLGALRLTRAASAYWWRLPLLPLFFLLEMTVAAAGMARRLLHLPQAWEAREVRGR